MDHTFAVGDKVEVTHRTDGARHGFKPGEYKAATVAEVCTYGGGYFVTFEEGGPRVGVYREDETREAIHTAPECLICSIQIGDDPDDDLERMRCSDHSL